ncbi:hypothetical protein BKA56DRAFT_614400 [Ilyonectria sp. MPI-CAGE-AT-0026]|nr:hypothetical protein BKA56DRAFT_614400 [Ilyonectria sp. MPI-CAGE-AT-0026]
MALSTFHHFTSLPYELRLNIWEFAVRPIHNDGGLHNRKSPPRVFYDCEREYIETERNEILHETEEEYRKTAWWFIEELTRLGTPHYAEMRDPVATYWNCFYADSCLEVLQVEIILYIHLPTPQFDSERHGHGGSIESEMSAQLPPRCPKDNNRTNCPSKLLYGVSSGLENIRMSWNV